MERMIERYYLKADHQTEWDEVTREQFIAAEQAAGFRSKFGPDHPATGGFSGKGMRGRVEYVTKQPRPEQASGEAKPEIWLLCARGEHDSCAGEAQLTRTGPPSKCGCNCHKHDAPAAPERGARDVDLLVSLAARNHVTYDTDLSGKLLAMSGEVREQYSTLITQRERLLEALKGVAIMLNTELEKYDSEPWAQRVRAAITTSEQEERR